MMDFLLIPIEKKYISIKITKKVIIVDEWNKKQKCAFVKKIWGVAVKFPE